MNAADFAAGRRLVRARETYSDNARAVAARLFKAEKSLEQTALDLNDLYAGLLEARRASGLSTTVGHELIHETTRAQVALTDALSAIVKVHAAAGRQIRELGLPRMDFGGSGGKPTGDSVADDFVGGA